MATEPYHTFWWATARMEWDGTGNTHTHTRNTTWKTHKLLCWFLLFALNIFTSVSSLPSLRLLFIFFESRFNQKKTHTHTSPRSFISLRVFNIWLRLQLAASKVCGHECSVHTTTMRIFVNTFQCAKVINSTKLDWQFDDGTLRPIEIRVFGTAFSETN